MSRWSMSVPAPNPAVTDAVVEADLMTMIKQLLSHESLCPDDILSRVRAEIPGMTMDRVLIALYENSAHFRRQRGRWYVAATPGCTCPPPVA